MRIKQKCTQKWACKNEMGPKNDNLKFGRKYDFENGLEKKYFRTRTL